MSESLVIAAVRYVFKKTALTASTRLYRSLKWWLSETFKWQVATLLEGAASNQRIVKFLRRAIRTWFPEVSFVSRFSRLLTLQVACGWSVSNFRSSPREGAPALPAHQLLAATRLSSRHMVFFFTIFQIEGPKGRVKEG